MLVVIALLAISAGITSDILVTLVRSYNKTQVANEVEQQANFVTLKLEKELKNAKNVTVEGTNKLTFVNTDGISISYEVASFVVKRTFGTEPSQDLTSASTGGVKVSCSPCFALSGATSPQIVTVKMTFTQAQNTPKTDLTSVYNYENVFVIRNSY